MKIQNKRTKIIATVGPAIDNYETLFALAEAGVDTFRINFSHGDNENRIEVIKAIERINNEHDAKVGILADLQGPKIRVGKVKGGKVNLEEGKEILIGVEEKLSDADELYIQYSHFAKDVVAGDRILIDDGKLELLAIESDGESQVKAKVIFGGVLSSNKGVNLPNSRISVPSLTEKDKNDLRFILEHDIQWIALSFVRAADDLTELRGIINFHNSPAKIIAKVERPEALQEIDGIIDAADGIMIARGDLGVEVPMERIPLIQKKITQKCIEACRPVVIATQMMESMIENSRPTRAEATDVANAVEDGADAVMLSGETSVGKYPLKVIQSMLKIIEEVEKEDTIYNREVKPVRSSKTYLSDAVCYNACNIAHHLEAKAIMGMTRSGYTAYQLACQRPKADIYIFTDSQALVRRLSLVWGVHAFFYDRFESTDGTINEVQQFLKKKGLLKSGDVVLNTGSMPLGKRGRTNMMKVSVVR